MRAFAALLVVLSCAATGLATEQRGPLDAIAKFRQHHRKTVDGRSDYTEDIEICLSCAFSIHAVTAAKLDLKAEVVLGGIRARSADLHGLFNC